MTKRESLIRNLAALRGLDRSENTNSRWTAATITLSAVVSDKQYREIVAAVRDLEARYERAGQTLI